MQIRVKKLDARAELPARAHADDAGADLAVCLAEGAEFVDIWPVSTRVLQTGLAIEIPYGHVGIIAARSSQQRRRLSVHGVIDAGYRGPVELIVTNVTHETIRVRSGERLAQLIVHAVALPTFVDADELSDTMRGAFGFGSTGQ